MRISRRSFQFSVRQVFAITLLCAILAMIFGGRRIEESSFERTPSAPIARRDVPDAAFKGLGEVFTENGKQGMDEFLFRQSVRYPSGRVRVLKTVLDNNHDHHLHPRGQFVLYEYFRADGTKEKERRVFPEKQLAASVIAAYSETDFAADGQTKIESRYFRDDRTLGTVLDGVTGRIKEFRSDGKTLRSEQTYVDKDCVLRYYRLDGKTLWWEYNFEKKRGRVFFDSNGKSYLKTFKRVSLAPKGYSMGPGSPQVPIYQDSYLREDGTVEYRQTWADCWDDVIWSTREVLTDLEVFDSDGKLLVKVDLRSDSKLPDGLDERMLHGFNVRATALYDDDSFDL